MNIGIIVYSQSGHTAEVAGKLKDRLIGADHSVQLERVTVVGERAPGAKAIEWENKPDVSGYEAVIFASYVEAFSLCRVMAQYMEGIVPLQGTQVACLVTQQFPYPWMGGNRAIRQMKRICQAKGAEIRATAVVNWAKSRREKTMDAAIAQLSKAF